MVTVARIPHKRNFNVSMLFHFKGVVRGTEIYTIPYLAFVTFLIFFKLKPVKLFNADIFFNNIHN